MKALSIPFDRVDRWKSRQTLVSLAIAFGTTALIALWSKSSDALTAADHALSFALGVVLPLTALSLVRKLSDGDNLRNFAAPEVRYGASRRQCVFASFWPLTGGLVLLAVLLTLVALVLTHGPGGERLRADVVASVPVACASAFAYSTWLAAGATFGARGAGSVWVLVADIVLGSMPLPVAFATPRGHVRHLLGLQASELAQWISFPALFGLALLGLAVLFVRVPR